MDGFFCIGKIFQPEPVHHNSIIVIKFAKHLKQGKENR